MSPTLKNTLRYLHENANNYHPGPVKCTWCRSENYIKHGTYQRYAILSEDLISIQRYYCKHDQCRRTFSILPHPFLRISRFSICLLQILCDLCDRRVSVAHMASIFDLSCGTIVRAVAKAKEIFGWIDEEKKADVSWSPLPCMNPSTHWSPFVSMFGAKFYPKRYGNLPPTQYEYCI